MRITVLIFFFFTLNLTHSQDVSSGKCLLISQVSDFDSIPEANAKMLIWNVSDSLNFSKELITNIDGKSEISIDQGQEYNIKIFKADTSFVFKEIKIPDLEYDFTMNYTFQIKVFNGYAEIIELDVHFSSNSAEIQIRDKEELDNLYNKLLNNSFLRIELASHTDSVGSDESNMRLSQKRSNSVKKYLVEKGIDDNRIVAKGYGEEEPKETNETVEGRATNRRTEVRIVK